MHRLKSAGNCTSEGNVLPWNLLPQDELCLDGAVESHILLERLGSLGRVCKHGLWSVSLSTLSWTTSHWWQESLALLMWYFLLSFKWDSGHFCCHQLAVTPAAWGSHTKDSRFLARKKAQDSLLFICTYQEGFWWKAKGSWPLLWQKDEINFPVVA